MVIIMIKCFFFSLQPRSKLLAAAGQIGEASQEVMDEIGETCTDMDKAFQVNASHFIPVSSIIIGKFFCKVKVNVCCLDLL